MKTLTLIRHADTQYPKLLQHDIDRTITPKGIVQATELRKYIFEKKIMPDKIVASTATRVRETAFHIFRNFENIFIQYDALLYHASTDVLKDYILVQEDSIQHLLLIGHNNGLTNLINVLKKNITHDLPTCGLCTFQIETKSWINYMSSPISNIDYRIPLHV